MSEAHYNRDSFDARLVTYEELPSESSRPGAFYYVVSEAGERIGIVSYLPSAGGGPPCIGATMFPGHAEPGHTWTWDGNVEKPTLSPSIHRVGHWHGFLRNGRFESC